MTRKQFATMVVLNEDQTKVLLLLREDFRIWTLPGGMIEAGESSDQAAVRETFEETGFETKVVSFRGTYLRPRLNDIRYVFEGQVIGGRAIQTGPETLAVSWFDLDKLPEKTTPFMQEIILDTLGGFDQNPFEKIQYVPTYLVITMRLMIWLRNLRNWITHRD